MGRRRRRRKGGTGARILRAAWFIAGAGVLVVGLAMGAHVFDGEGEWEPSRSLEHPARESSEGVAPPATWDRIRVEVLNAGGTRGMAARATDYLRDRGFDVVYYGNASSFGLDSTRVLDRTGSLEAARAVAGILGTGVPEVDPDTSRFVDVTVLLGTDWSDETVTPADSSGSQEEGDAWWDLRRFFVQK